MAITLKTKSLNALGALKHLPISDVLQFWLEQSPVDVKLTATQFQFRYATADGVKTAHVDVTLDQLQKLQAKTLTQAEKNSLISQLHAVIAGIKSMEYELVPLPADDGVLAQLPPLQPAFQYAITSTNPAPKPASAVKSTQQQPAPAMWATFDQAKMKTAPTVKLRDATMMYQPVAGTSGGSRYFLVAGNDDVRVAARYDGSKLSVRIEGPKWEKHAASIKACGFDVKDPAYTSLHLAVPEFVLAQKTLGAVLLGLGVPMDTPMPNLNVIKGH